MEGVYDFDGRGIATALSGPQWSVEALRHIQGILQQTADTLVSPTVPDEQASEATDRMMAALAKRDERLVSEIKKAVDGKPRPVVARFVTYLLATVGGLVTLREGAQYGYEAVKFVVDQFFTQ